MAEEPRFDWSAIFRAAAVVTGGVIAYSIIVPIGATLALKLVDTGRVAGHEFFRWGFWGLAWALIVWQGSWMLKHVHERIIDDMLVTGALTAVVLLITIIVVALVYGSKENPVALITAIDAGGALMLFVVALVAARINRY